VSEVFGIHAVQAVLEEAPGRVRTVLVLKGRQDKRLQQLLALARDARVRVEFVDKRRLDRLAGGAHQGVVASCQELAPLSERELEALWEELATPRLLLVLDGVEDPRNMGACLRSAAAAGAQVVLLPRSRSAPLSAVALKTAAGAAERLHIVEVANLARRLAWLQSRGVWVVGAAGGAEQPWTAAAMSGDLALVLGSEQAGLRALTAKHCDELVRIPMAPGVESLNVSVAAGVLLFEAVRQRLASEASAP
jgi:23S rRNA (guanosine2251-2'-O)-methyltransferase